MRLALSEEQEMLRRTARDFLAERCPKSFVRKMEESDTGHSAELWREMAELGWMGLALPEGYGGGGMSFLDLAVLLEEMGRACLPGPFFSTVVLGALTILDAGSEQQRQRYLPGVVRGESTISLAVPEPNPPNRGRPAMMLEAKAEGDNYAIEGTCLFVPNAHIVDHLVCVARTGDPEGVALFVVSPRSPHIHSTVLKSIGGDKLCEVVFDGLVIPKVDVLARHGDGESVARKIVERAAVAKCCEMVGNIQRVLEMTVDYAKERKQFDRPIGSFQAIQHYCADMATDVDGARLSTYRAAWMLSQGLPCTREVAVAKAWMGEASRRIMDRAHQIHGAIGVSMEHDLHFYTRRAKAAELTFGGSDLYREVVASEMGLG
jgi:3-oxocholest-4-en-26-oyl-CoA dehydrogenase beta subunit